jgi:hypothetical protein
LSVASKPAWYSIERMGVAGDVVNLLHPPYTLWHLSYVLMGISLAPTIFVGRSFAVLLAFFLGLGVGAHALDETMGNPLKTRLSKRNLYVIGLGSLASAAALGLYYVLTLTILLLPIIAAEIFFAVAYNLEIFQKRFHTTLVFAVSWGVIPFLTGYYVNSLTMGASPLIMAVGVGLLTCAQRTLSTQARTMRRRVTNIDGLRTKDGGIISTSSADLARPSESALKVLTATIFLFAVALVVHRFF